MLFRKAVRKQGVAVGKGLISIVMRLLRLAIFIIVILAILKRCIFLYEQLIIWPQISDRTCSFYWSCLYQNQAKSLDEVWRLNQNRIESERQKATNFLGHPSQSIHVPVKRNSNSVWCIYIIMNQGICDKKSSYSFGLQSNIPITDQYGFQPLIKLI